MWETNQRGRRQKAGSTVGMNALPGWGQVVVSAGPQEVLGRRSSAEGRVREWLTASSARARPPDRRNCGTEGGRWEAGHSG